MLVFEALKDMIVEFTSASTGEGIGRAHGALVKRFGCEATLILDTSRVFDAIAPAIVYSARGRRPMEEVDAQKSPKDNPVVRRANESEVPFLFSELKREKNISNEEWARLIPAPIRDWDGLQVPIYENGKMVWFVGSTGPTADVSWQARSIVTTAAFAAYARWRELLDDKKSGSPLTPRESECLRLVSIGKSDEEIGAALGISPRTVRFHVGNAKTKLGVTTRIQAVAKRLGAA